MLTDNEDYLETYQTAARGVEKELDEVRQLTIDNPVQRDRVIMLTTLTHQRLASLQKVITTQDTEGADEALDTLMTSGSMATDEDMHKVIQERETDEKHLVAQQEAAATTHARRMRRLTVAVGTFAFLLVGLAGVFLNRDVLKMTIASHPRTCSIHPPFARRSNSMPLLRRPVAVRRVALRWPNPVARSICLAALISAVCARTKCWRQESVSRGALIAMGVSRGT